MTKTDPLAHHKAVSRRLTDAVNNYKRDRSEPMAATARRLLIEHIALTLRHGSIARVSARSRTLPGYEALTAKRAKAVDVLSIWRRIDAAEKAGVYVGGIEAPCRETAARVVEETTIELKKAASRIANAAKPKPKRRPKPKRSERPAEEMTTPDLILEAQRPTTTTRRKDEIWRVAKTRRWTRAQLRKAFEGGEF